MKLVIEKIIAVEFKNSLLLNRINKNHKKLDLLNTLLIYKR